MGWVNREFWRVDMIIQKLPKKSIRFVHGSFKAVKDIGDNMIAFPKPIHKKEKRKRVTPLPKLLKKADDVFAKWIRTRDGHCYGQEIPQEAGKCKMYLCNCHLFGRGKKALRFDEQNCNGGCMYHNQIHDHTMRPQPHIYINWFINKYGLEAYQDLTRRSYIIKKWSRDELEEIIKKYTL